MDFFDHLPEIYDKVWHTLDWICKRSWSYGGSVGLLYEQYTDHSTTGFVLTNLLGVIVGKMIL